MKKIILPILVVILCIIIGTRLIKADREYPQHYSTNYFIKNAIHQYQDCKRISQNSKTFVDYELLWAELDKDWYFEFYILWNWQWFYIDERWNLNNNCSFAWLPITVTLGENKNWYYILKYQVANKSDSQSVKSIFSESAYKNRLARRNRENHEKISFLDDAEQHFWINLDENNEFKCSFCDKKRYYYESIENEEWERMNLYGTEQLSNNYLKFSSDWTLTKPWTHDKSKYTRHFGKDESTIIIKEKDNDSVIERFIIDQLKNNELIAFSEYIQIQI